MDVINAIMNRKSVRGFKPDPVPKEILKKILEVSLRSPSSANGQPWHITVVTGEPLETIKRENVEKAKAGIEPNPDVPRPPPSGIYRQRQVELAAQLLTLLGISRNDLAKRAEWNQRGLRYFDAPAVIILTSDNDLAVEIAQFDLGLLAQSICLAALKYRLGTCIERQGVMYPDVIRQHTGIPFSQRITIAIAIGYPDWDFPANKYTSSREPPERVVKWSGS